MYIQTVQYNHNVQSNRNDCITVFVKSKRIPVVTSYNAPQLLPIGPFMSLTSSRRGIVVYENILDDYQESILVSIKRFARNNGMQVEIKDVSKENILKRLFRRILGQKIDRIAISIPETALSTISKNFP